VLTEFSVSLIVLKEFSVSLVVLSEFSVSLIVLKEFSVSLVVLSEFSVSLAVLTEFSASLVLWDSSRVVYVGNWHGIFNSVHEIHGESAGSFHLMNEESTGGRGFRQELPAHRRGIHPRKGIPPGITRLFKRILAGKVKICGKSFKQYQFQDQQF
jgi:hypothetical protein